MQAYCSRLHGMGMLVLEDEFAEFGLCVCDNVQLSIIERRGNGTNVLEIPEFVVVITMFF